MVAARVYADASALVKLVLDEPESEALRQFMGERGGPVTSRIATIEVRRAVAHALDVTPDHEAVLEAIWEGTIIVELDHELAETAALIAPSVLKSLDAIHLATAALVRDEIAAFVSYDRRLAEAARSIGLTVVDPG